MPNFWVLRWKRKFNPPDKFSRFVKQDEAVLNQWHSVICTTPAQLKRFTEMLSKDASVIQVEVKEKV